jgi:hypothetical protein
MVDVALTLGTAVVKTAIKLWLKDAEFAQDPAATVVDMVNIHVGDIRQRRRVLRQMGQLEEVHRLNS